MEAKRRIPRRHSTILCPACYAVHFNLLLFEVNCDTGRLIAAATHSDRDTSSAVDGCSVRVQEIQDFWYYLSESDPSDEQFQAGVDHKVHELAIAFREILVSHLGELYRTSSSQRFRYRVYGSDPGVVVYEESFSRT